MSLSLRHSGLDKKLFLVAADIDVQHASESQDATRSSLYHAVPQGVQVFREDDWVGNIGHGQTTISVLVKNPEVEHKVRMLDFDRWLASGSRSPAELKLNPRVRELQSPSDLGRKLCRPKGPGQFPIRTRPIGPISAILA